MAIMMVVRDAGRLVAPAVSETISALHLAPEDAGVVRLAHEYAKLLDAAPGDVDIWAKIAPKLQAALEALGASPRARAAIKKGGVQSRAESRLEVLRAARAN